MTPCVTMNLLVDSGAEFSPCGRYRHLLWRIWDDTKPLLCMAMLNPSKAGRSIKESDPTVSRQMKRAYLLGFGGLLVVNVFNIVATDPKDMLAAEVPSSPENDAAILKAAQRADMVICAWGTNGNHRGRADEVRKLLGSIPLYALKVTTGEPWHPLYLPYELVPFRLERAS